MYISEDIEISMFKLLTLTVISLASVTGIERVSHTTRRRRRKQTLTHTERESERCHFNLHSYTDIIMNDEATNPFVLRARISPTHACIAGFN